MPLARDLLADGDLVVIGQVAGASNATFVCEATVTADAGVDVSEESTDTGNPVLRCVYKPVRGERPLWDFPDGTLAGREYASYCVSDALGWEVIPRTILRDGPFGPGMVQQWVSTPDRHAELGGLDLVDLCEPNSVPPGWFEILQGVGADGAAVSLIHVDDPRVQRVAVLDLLLNNADRKGGHVLEGLDGHVYGVDHGICLHTEPKLRTVLWGWAGREIPSPLVADIEALTAQLRGDLGASLVEHVTVAEVQKLIERAEQLGAGAMMPSPSGPAHIPWPPF